MTTKKLDQRVTNPQVVSSSAPRVAVGVLAEPMAGQRPAAQARTTDASERTQVEILGNKKTDPDLFRETLVDRFQVESVISSCGDPTVSIEERESRVLEVVAVFHKLVDHFSRDNSVLTHLFPNEYGPIKYVNDDVYAFRWTYRMLKVYSEQLPYPAKQSEKALDAIRAAVQRIEDLRTIAD